MKEVLWTTRFMVNWADVVSDVLGLTINCELPPVKCDRVIIMGMFVTDTENLDKMFEMTKQVVVYWVGSDVTMQTASKCAYMSDPRFKHLVVSDWKKRELEGKGLKATTVELPIMNHFEVTPFHKEKAVAFYGGDDYGLQMAKQVVKRAGATLLHYEFGDLTRDELKDVVDRSQVYLRLHPNDGFPGSVREYLQAGRRVVSTVRLEGVNRVRHDDEDGIFSAVTRCLEMPEPDYAMAERFRRFNSDERFVKKFRKALGDA